MAVLRSVTLLVCGVYQSFRQRVSSPTYEVDSPTSNVSSPRLICQSLPDPFGSAVDERTRNKLYGVKLWAHIFSGLFGTAVDKRTRNNWYACKGKSGPVCCGLAALANRHSTLANRLHTLANWLVGETTSLWHLFTMVVWGKTFLQQCLNYKLKLTVNFIWIYFLNWGEIKM